MTTTSTNTPAPDRWRRALKEYILHVERQEGISFLGCKGFVGPDVPDEDWALLQEVYAELKVEDPNFV